MLFGFKWEEHLLTILAKIISKSFSSFEYMIMAFRSWVSIWLRDVHIDQPSNLKFYLKVDRRLDFHKVLLQLKNTISKVIRNDFNISCYSNFNVDERLVMIKQFVNSKEHFIDIKFSLVKSVHIVILVLLMNEIKSRRTKGQNLLQIFNFSLLRKLGFIDKS